MSKKTAGEAAPDATTPTGSVVSPDVTLPTEAQLTELASVVGEDRLATEIQALNEGYATGDDPTTAYPAPPAPVEGLLLASANAPDAQNAATIFAGMIVANGGYKHLDYETAILFAVRAARDLASMTETPQL